MSKERLTELYHKYLQNNCTPEELRELVNALGADDLREEEAFALFDTTWDGLKPHPGKYPLPANPPILRPVRNRWRIAAAATVIGLIATGIFLLTQPKDHPPIVTQTDTTAIQPGSNKAVLTLANGQRIVLDEAENGNLAQQGGTQITKQDSTLAYNAGNSTTGVSINTLTTPRGGFFSLNLADGTKVWLNASSSLRFPTAFTGSDRSVQLTGEAYFEVAQNAGKPFRVKVNNMEVQVLGTRFNINAYTDEQSIRTTLLDGAVNIQSGPSSTRLQPGDQASITTGADQISISRPDLEQVIAWKNGMFSFNGADLQQVMRQLSRWYDVEIRYSGPVKNRLFVGSIPRSYQLQEVLSILEASDVHFRLTGKQIIVTP